jgi:hypothetical protein
MALSPDQWRMAEALAVQQQHGADAPRFVAERIGALVLEGDVAGVERWQKIATAMDALMLAARQ